MRYATVILAPPNDPHSNDQKKTLEADPRKLSINGTVVATQEAMHYVNLLDDGTAVGMAQFRGDAERIAEMQKQMPEILNCTVTGNETLLAYMHYKPDDIEKSLLELLNTQEISVDWPIIYTLQGMQLTLFGEDSTLNQMITNIPDEVRTTLERAGDYQPGMRDPTWQLTDRQQEIVCTAIDAGYYDIPRSTTQRDLAAKLDLSRGTVGEHLRRAEVKIIRAVIA